MGADDLHRISHQLDDAAVESLIYRLESRAKDEVFTKLFDRYAGKLRLPASSQVLEIGCGTGAVLAGLLFGGGAVIGDGRGIRRGRRFAFGGQFIKI